MLFLNFFILGILSAPFLLIYLIFFKGNIPEEVIQEEQKGFELPKSFIFSLAIIILAINIFLYNTGELGIGFSLCNLAALIAFILLLPKRKHTPIIYLLAAVSAFLGFGVAFRASGIIQGLDIVLIKYITFIILLSILLENINWKGTWLIRAIWLLILRAFRNVPIIFKSSKNYKTNVVITVIKSFFITFFLVLLFAILLSSADPVFKKLIADLLPQITGRSILSIFVSIVLVFIFSARLKVYLDKEASFNFISFYELFMPILAVVLLFGSFIFVQAKYLFGSHTYIQEFGLTYSEYVRKGFTELLITALLGSIISYLTTIRNRLFDNKNHEVYIKILNSILVLELFFMLASAFMRDKIYVDTYGYTRVRVIGGVFLIWLAINLLMLLVLNVIKKFPEKYLFATVSYVAFILVIGLNITNVDAFIIKQNIPHTEYSSKDYFYTNILSEDAISGWKDSINFATDTFDSLYKKPNLSDNERKLLTDIKLSMISLKEKRDNLVVKFGSIKDLEQLALSDPHYKYNIFEDLKELKLNQYTKNIRNWQSLNFSKREAYQEMQKNHTLFFDTPNCLIKEIQNYQLQNNVDLYTTEDNRLNAFEYPFVNAHLQYAPRSNDSILRDQYYEKYGYNTYQTERDLLRVPRPTAKSCK